MKKLILGLILTLFSLSATADHKEEGTTYGFYWNYVPAVCGVWDEIKRFADDNHFVEFSASVGRKDGQPDGQIQYMVIHWINFTKDESMATVSVPGGNETCIIYRTFDVKVNQDLVGRGS